MVSYDLRTLTSGSNSIAPAEYAFTVISGSTIDTKDYESLTFHTLTGAVTDGTYTVSLVAGDVSDLSDSAAVPSTEILGSNPTIPATQDGSVHSIGTNTKKRYVQQLITGESVSSGGFFSSTAVLGHPKSAPTP
jgi:hypothetical protein